MPDPGKMMVTMVRGKSLLQALGQMEQFAKSHDDRSYDGEVEIRYVCLSAWALMAIRTSRCSSSAMVSNSRA